jgi:hypothetical protein
MHMSRKNWDTARHSRNAIRARLQLLAIERGLRPAQLPKSVSGKAMLAFCERHKVSMDWLYFGALRGLWGMAYYVQNPNAWDAGCGLPRNFR